MLHSINNWSVVQYSTNTTSVTKMVTIPVTKILNLDTQYIHFYSYKCGYKANYYLIHSFVWLQGRLLPDTFICMVTSAVTRPTTSSAWNSQWLLPSQYCNVPKHHMRPAGVEGRMELRVGCVAWLILPCCTTHRAKWNGQP